MLARNEAYTWGSPMFQNAGPAYVDGIEIRIIPEDNTRLAEYSNPSLTTVDVHRDMLGQMAADALHELSRSPNPQGREYQIPAELILGDSSGPAPSEQMP